MIYDKLENLSGFVSQNIYESIIDLLTIDSFQSGLKKHIVNDELIINYDEYAPKNVTDCVLETHKRYVDIHILLDGEEVVKVIDKKLLQSKTEYDTNRDVKFYEMIEKYPVNILLTKGYFLLINQDEAHITQIKPNDEYNKKVKKIVIKIEDKFLTK
jgi:YhcH/YjgK/YiaL family protein